MRGYRDLALVLARRAKTRSKPAARADYLRAIELLGHVLRKQTDTRLANMLILAVTDLNAVFGDARAAGVSRKDFPLDKRLIDRLDVDLRIVLSWDTDETVVDLHVIEPSGEEVHMRHPRSQIGGRLMEQFTRSAGPQEYALKEAMPGIYRIKVKYFTSRPAKVFGSVTGWVDIYTNFARRDQTHRRIRLRLIDNPRTLDVATVRF